MSAEDKEQARTIILFLMAASCLTCSVTASFVPDPAALALASVGVVLGIFTLALLAIEKKTTTHSGGK